MPPNCSRPSFANSSLDSFLQVRVFPVLFFLATSLILCLLYGLFTKHRHRLGTPFLSVAGVLVLLLFLLSVPQSLLSFPTIYSLEAIRRLYLSWMLTIFALLNGFSAVDSLVTAAVSLQFYLQATESSFRKFLLPVRRQVLLLLAFFALGLLISLSTIRQHSLFTYLACGGEVLRHRLQFNMPIWMAHVVKGVQSLCVIFLPCMVVLLSNYRLACSLRFWMALPSLENKQLLEDENELTAVWNRLPLMVYLHSFVFIGSHVFSFLPFVLSLLPVFLTPSLTYSFISFSAFILLSGKLFSFLLLYKISHQLERLGLLINI